MAYNDYVMVTPCYCIKLRKAAQRVTTLYDEALMPFGLTAPEYALLRMVERRGPSTISALAEDAELTQDAMRETVQAVVVMDLLQEHGCGHERDTVVILSDNGKAMLEQTLPVWQACQKDISDRLGSEAVGMLDILLERL